MEAQFLNSILIAIVGYFVARVLKKVDDIDVSARGISTDIALIKQDRKLIWEKISQMEADLEELKCLVKSR